MIFTWYLLHQKTNRPFYIQRPQIPIMLPNSKKNHGYSSGMHHTDECSNHVAHSIALTDDETIKASSFPKRLIEAPCLSHRVRTNERFTNHQDLIWLSKLSELLETAHQTGIIVSAASSINEDNVKLLSCCVRDGVFGDVRRVFAVPLFVQLDFS